MNYKIITLTIVFSATTLVNFGKDNNAEIQELKNYRFKKELELSEMGKMVAEKDELFQSIWEKGNNFSLEVINNKKRHFNFTEQQTQDFIETINLSLENFHEDLDRAMKEKQNIKQFFVQALLNQDENLNESERNFEKRNFESLKFMVVRHALERNLMKTLVERYGELQQELFEIDQQIADL